MNASKRRQCYALFFNINIFILQSKKKSVLEKVKKKCEKRKELKYNNHPWLETV